MAGRFDLTGRGNKISIRVIVGKPTFALKDKLSVRSICCLFPPNAVAPENCCANFSVTGPFLWALFCARRLLRQSENAAAIMMCFFMVFFVFVHVWPLMMAFAECNFPIFSEKGILSQASYPLSYCSSGKGVTSMAILH
jgi:hypothetical protein